MTKWKTFGRDATVFNEYFTKISKKKKNLLDQRYMRFFGSPKVASPNGSVSGLVSSWRHDSSRINLVIIKIVARGCLRNMSGCEKIWEESY